MKKQTKILLSAVIGNGLEFYDFTLFGAFTIKFSQFFFGSEGGMSQGIRNALLIFGVGFLARPVGALFFGYIGDKWGRKKALSLSIILMGIATFIIGCLPTYEAWGLAAPLGLCLLRCLQGFCLGGENNGSAIFFLEHLKERRGLAGALILTGGAVGTVLAYGASIAASLPGMPPYAWRIPFLLGLFVGMLGLYIRNSLPESVEFLTHQSTFSPRAPFSEVWRHYRRPFLCAIGVGGVNVALAYTTTTYLHVYMANIVGLSLINSLACTCIAITLFGFLFAPLMGHLADRFSPYRVMHTGCLALAFFAFPLFYVLRQGGEASGPLSGVAVLGGIILSACLMGTFNGPSNAYLNTLFPPTVRYTAVAFGYALGSALFGGMAPYYYQWLIYWSQNTLAPALYLIFIAALGVASLRYSRREAKSSEVSAL